jgi:hypothetical protein
MMLRDLRMRWGRIKILRTVILCGALALLHPARHATASAKDSSPLSDLTFHSSNASLNESFQWAKQQALHYVRSAQGPIGSWYEAALPGRNAFCMRDVSHQTEGAAALGLAAANRNMLHLFAESAAASREWAGYWEIDGSGKPSAFDYRSDSDFWFNLPANFDVLDAAVRMWRWTGDDFYRLDPGFQSFYRETLTDYISQWQLGPEAILKRPRIANQRLAKGEFVSSRGIPSYVEGPKDFIFGTDLLAAEYRAIRSYREIASRPGDVELAARLQKSADAIQHILETVCWDAKRQHFHGVIGSDLSGSGSGDTFALYFDAVKDPTHIRGALDSISDPAYWRKINIEEESYVPLVLFRYGRPETAYRVLLDLADRNKPRREYPEVSYAVVAALVSGAMGIEPAHEGDDYDVQTLPQPLTKDDDLFVSSLPIKGNMLEISHSGDKATRFRNTAGAALRWRAAFMGDFRRLLVNGRPVDASHGSLRGGQQISFTTVSVKPGETTVVSVEGIQ